MKRKFRDLENSFTYSFFFQSVKKFIQTKKITSTFIVLFLTGIGGFIYLYIISRDLPSLRQLEEYRPKLASKVYSADMKLIHEYYEEKRSFVPLEQMPDALIRAVIASEDRKFYDHWGIDLKRFIKVAFINFITLKFKPRAISTLTQQLARQLYLTSEKTITRKIREMITAIQIERTYTKDEILEMYLNHMFLGHGLYGAQPAAMKYFGKELQDIDTAECATLIGLLPAPEAYSPIRHPNRALTRRNIVLHAMRELDYITEDDYNEYLKKPINVLKYTTSTAYGIAPYFTEYVRQILQEKYGYNLYTEGLSIYTTLDTRAQACAEEAVENHLKIVQKNVNNYYLKDNRIMELLDVNHQTNDNVKKLLQDSTFVDSLLNARVAVQTALVSIDPRNGHILAFIGGRDFSESKWNRVVQMSRQPGSAFKPFIYTVAIDNGYPPIHEELNQPVVVFMENGERWSPQNYDLSVGGPTTMREGLRRSLNLVTVRVLQNVIQNPSRVVEYARKMGIKSPLQAVDAIALGASGVTPMEITSAFGVFANGGVLVEPVAILRVEDKNGNVLEQNIPRSQEALRKETAYIMTDLLKTVIDKGTGGSARWKYHFYRPAGGKTGTTNDFSDAWFIAFTPQIVTGVWVGLDDYSLTLGKGQEGSRAALPICATYMKSVHDTLGLPELDFPMPEGVVRLEICADTKKLANDVCPNILEEVFESRLAPTENCDIHVGLTRRERLKRIKNKQRIRF
ncbi:MAG: penicillin-binding protein 1A [bacterium]